MEPLGPRWQAGYRELFEGIKARVHGAQLRAASAASQELLLLYFGIGLDLHIRSEHEAWGTAVIDRLSRDLGQAFPGMEGFSPRNLRRMRSFYRSYPLDSRSKARWLAGDRRMNLLVWPQAVAKLPWGHNVVLIEKCKSLATREWYGAAALEHGWSRDVLVHQIEAGLHERQGKAVTNFKATLPPLQSEMAEQTIKDPYTFGFLTLADDAREKELEHGLVDHVRKFLLELGAGFAFVGQQVHLEVGGDDFYLDLLFYNLRLRCFVVVELKNGPFKPEYAGKMSFYLSAVDDRMRHKDDQAGVGIILCRTKNKLVAEYALRDVRKPIGVSAFRLTKALPAGLKGTLPSVGELENEFGSEEP